MEFPVTLLIGSIIAGVFIITVSLTLSYQRKDPVPVRVVVPQTQSLQFGLRPEEYAAISQPQPLAPTIPWLNSVWAANGCKTTLDERSGASFMGQTLAKAELEIKRLAAAVIACTGTRAEIYMCNPTSSCLTY